MGVPKPRALAPVCGPRSPAGEPLGLVLSRRLTTAPLHDGGKGVPKTKTRLKRHIFVRMTCGEQGHPLHRRPALQSPRSPRRPPSSHGPRSHPSRGGDLRGGPMEHREPPTRPLFPPPALCLSPPDRTKPVGCASAINLSINLLIREWEVAQEGDVDTGSSVFAAGAQTCPAP